MSYIPKYIQKRIFPSDCVKLKGNGIEFTFINILAPMKVEEIPAGDEYLTRYSLKVDGAEVPIDLMRKAQVTVNGKEYSATNIKAMEGQVIPVGGKIVIFAPVTELAGKKLVKGTEHEFHVIIKWTGDHKDEYGPLTRTIC